MFEQLLEKVQRYNKEHEKEGGQVFLQPYEAAAAMKLDESKPKPRKIDAMPFLLALVTPLLARIHKMVTQSAKLVFCDSTASLDNLNTAVFILSCGTSVGALPLAAVMTFSEDAVTLSAGFTALCHILPKCAFFGRGPHLGPLTLLTDDCASEWIALKGAWPQAELHLCVFHYLQRI